MGVASSRSFGEDYNEQLLLQGSDFKDYKILSVIYDHRFGEVKLAQKIDSSDKFYIKIFQTNNDDKYLRMINNIKKQKKIIQNPNVLNIIDYHIKSDETENDYCIFVLLPFINHDLEQEILKRSLIFNKLCYFSENFLWRLVVDVVTALAHLQKLKISNCEVFPSSIVLCEDGSAKIANQQFFVPQTNYLRLVKTKKRGDERSMFFSPLLIKGICKKLQNPVHNPYKSSVFALGVTLLQAMLLISVDDVYDYKSKLHNISFERLQQYIYKAGHMYSKKLTFLVARMLTENENLRPDFILIQSALECIDDESCFQAKLNQNIVSYNEKFQQQSQQRLLKGDEIANNQLKLQQSQREIITQNQNGAFGYNVTDNALLVKDINMYGSIVPNSSRNRAHQFQLFQSHNNEQALIQQQQQNNNNNNSNNLNEEENNLLKDTILLEKDQSELNKENVVRAANKKNQRSVSVGAKVYQQAKFNLITGKFDNANVPLSTQEEEDNIKAQQDENQEEGATTIQHMWKSKKGDSTLLQSKSQLKSSQLLQQESQFLQGSNSNLNNLNSNPNPYFNMLNSENIEQSASNMGLVWNNNKKFEDQVVVAGGGNEFEANFGGDAQMKSSRIESISTNPFVIQQLPPQQQQVKDRYQNIRIAQSSVQNQANYGLGVGNTNYLYRNKSANRTESNIPFQSQSSYMPNVNISQKLNADANLNLNQSQKAQPPKMTSSNTYNRNNGILKKEEIKPSVQFAQQLNDAQIIEDVYKNSDFGKLDNSSQAKHSNFMQKTQLSQLKNINLSDQSSQQQMAISNKTLNKSYAKNSVNNNNTYNNTSNSTPPRQAASLINKAGGSSYSAVQMKTSQQPVLQVKASLQQSTHQSAQKNIQSVSATSNNALNYYHVKSNEDVNKNKYQQNMYNNSNINQQRIDYSSNLKSGLPYESPSKIQRTLDKQIKNIAEESINKYLNEDTVTKQKYYGISRQTPSYGNYQNQSNLNSKITSHQNLNSSTTPISNIGKQIVNESYQNGSRYEGEKLNGMRTGQGTFYYALGGIYQGEWLENKMNGYGILYYKGNKPAYEGQWKNDKFHGKGILINENPSVLYTNFNYLTFDNIKDFWIQYEGDFVEDNKQGMGTLFLSNGEKFVGQFVEDKINGKGTYYQRNGDIIQGCWINNSLQM